jgi:SAM-dependent methyltransferase
MLAPIRACRSCGHRHLSEVLSIGCTPLANGLLTAAQLSEPEDTYPLSLVFCPHCTLLQITETVPPEKLFRRYFYLSSYSDTLLHHAENISSKLIKSRRLNGKSLVVEIASNDGYLLQYYQRAGIPVLGVEPATNIARVAEDRGISTVCDFFGDPLAGKLAAKGVQADVIHANNVLAHVPDLNGVVRGFERLLKESGIVVVEVPYVIEMIDRCEFDTIYHEHLCYFSLTALERLFRRNGLVIYDVERLAIHGGTLRIYARAESRQNGADEQGLAVKSLLETEVSWHAQSASVHRKFRDQVETVRESLLDLLHELKQKQKRIAAYGASAKGSTLLNSFGIDKRTIDFVVDRSAVKQGLYTPGTHLPIYAPEKLVEEMPDYALLLTWNFADEILAQQAEYRLKGGRFIVPIPEVKII